MHLADDGGSRFEALDRVGRARRAGAGRKAIGALLGKIADRAFHRRPILFLIGRELASPAMQRIGEGANVFGRQRRAASGAPGCSCA